jgi:hypothetical protein
MLHEYHVIYSVRYYPRFYVPAVGLGTYYPWIRGHYCISNSFVTCGASARLNCDHRRHYFTHTHGAYENYSEKKLNDICKSHVTAVSLGTYY